eukprot:TRINITY_DN40811_c0_g1_i2.p2 TRINITY_DN40811_c0_g1~~TRINITY_DN40811_c0_g1_i2.p2  ORF type:complete len:361 (+),score=96.31 TRINITY_DN40811_c0_g1_i2:84-1085(+)
MGERGGAAARAALTAGLWLRCSDPPADGSTGGAAPLTHVFCVSPEAGAPPLPAADGPAPAPLSVRPEGVGAAAELAAAVEAVAGALGAGGEVLMDGDPEGCAAVGAAYLTAELGVPPAEAAARVELVSGAGAGGCAAARGALQELHAAAEAQPSCLLVTAPARRLRRAATSEAALRRFGPLFRSGARVRRAAPHDDGTVWVVAGAAGGAVWAVREGADWAEPLSAASPWSYAPAEALQPQRRGEHEPLGPPGGAAAAGAAGAAPPAAGGSPRGEWPLGSGGARAAQRSAARTACAAASRRRARRQLLACRFGIPEEEQRALWPQLFPPPEASD